MPKTITIPVESVPEPDEKLYGFVKELHDLASLAKLAGPEYEVAGQNLDKVLSKVKPQFPKKSQRKDIVELVVKEVQSQNWIQDCCRIACEMYDRRSSMNPIEASELFRQMVAIQAKFHGPQQVRSNVYMEVGLYALSIINTSHYMKIHDSGEAGFEQTLIRCRNFAEGK